MKARNIFKKLPRQAKRESFTILTKSGGLAIERIISRGHRSPPGFWYDQDFDEWLLLLRGAAQLQIAGERRRLHLKEGDYLLIPARKRHRVEWTHPKKQTVWLIVKGQSISEAPRGKPRGIPGRTRAGFAEPCGATDAIHPCGNLPAVLRTALQAGPQGILAKKGKFKKQTKVCRT